MPVIEYQQFIKAPVEICFDLEERGYPHQNDSENKGNCC